MGEYAVLCGAPAVVMAVNRRLYLHFHARDSSLPFDHSDKDNHGSREKPPISPEIALALCLGEGHANAQNWNFALDTTALHDQTGEKLGLGSSAAKAVASAAFVHQSTNPADIFETGLAAHRAVAPQGSGADVAASTYGGLISFEMTDTHVPKVQPMVLPTTLQWRTYFSGRSASTAELLDLVARYGAKDRAGHQAAMTALGNASMDFGQACRTQSTEACRDAVRAHCRALRELGQRAGAAIVDDALETLTRELPGSAAIKPSGAGGGDISIAFFDRDASVSKLDALALKHGFRPLELNVDWQGARFE